MYVIVEIQSAIVKIRSVIPLRVCMYVLGQRDRGLSGKCFTTDTDCVSTEQVIFRWRKGRRVCREKEWCSFMCAELLKWGCIWAWEEGLGCKVPLGHWDPGVGKWRDWCPAMKGFVHFTWIYSDGYGKSNQKFVNTVAILLNLCFQRRSMEIGLECG